MFGFGPGELIVLLLIVVAVVIVLAVRSSKKKSTNTPLDSWKQPTDLSKCPQCGTPIPAGATFCKSCGCKLIER